MHDAIIPPSRVRLYVPHRVSWPQSQRELRSAHFTGGGPGRLGGVILCLMLLLSAQSAKALDDAVLELYQQGQFETAATRGLIQLLAEPWNHRLRFVVADSLQRGGRYDDAASQFQALEGTPYAQSAALRLNVLRSLQRAPKSAPAAPALGAMAQKIVAPTAAVTPVAKPAPPPPPVAEVEVQPVVAKVAVPPPRHPALKQDLLCGAQSAPVPDGTTAQGSETQFDDLRLIIANDLAGNGPQDKASPQNHPQPEGQVLPVLRSVLTISTKPCQERP